MDIKHSFCVLLLAAASSFVLSGCAETARPRVPVADEVSEPGAARGGVNDETSELMRRAGADVVTEGEALLTFPNVNRWDAPLVPIQSGYVACHRNVVLDRRDRVVTDIRSFEIEAGRGTHEGFRSSLLMGVSALRKEAMKKAGEDNVGLLIARNADPVIVAMWLAWQNAEGGKAADTRVWRLSTWTHSHRAELAYFPELSVRDGLLWMEWAEAPGSPARSVSDVPLYPKAGDVTTGYIKGMQFMRRETIRVKGGGVFRCWVVERKDYPNAEKRRIEWYAPGVGLVLRIAVPPDGGSFDLSVWSVVEVMLPRDGLYWKAVPSLRGIQ